MFSSVFGFIKDVVMEFINVFSKTVLEKLYQFIKEADLLDVDGFEKNKYVFNKIKEYLSSQGKTVSSSILNLAIELLVRKMKLAKTN
jgi:hypothetical protein